VGTLDEPADSNDKNGEAWSLLRGALKDVFAELGGGEAYLRAERSSFDKPRDPECFAVKPEEGR